MRLSVVQWFGSLRGDGRWLWYATRMLTLGAWLHTMDPFAIEAIGLRWYGLAYIGGFVCAWWMLWRMARAGTVRVAPDRVIDVILTCVLGVLIGGLVIAMYLPIFKMGQVV